jgi:hypothetical protein
MNGFPNLSFEEILLIVSIGLLIVISVQSIFLCLKRDERITIVFRHISGFSVGLIDQTFMVIFNFQPTFSAVVILFDYVAYGCWFMLMPNFFELRNRNLFIVLWVLGSGTFNILFEHAAWFILFGYLPYPTEPIVWTSFHTIIFYMGMHAIGTLVILVGFKAEKLKKQISKDYLESKNMKN